MEDPDDLVGCGTDLGLQRARHGASADAGREVETLRDIERGGGVAGAGTGSSGFAKAR